jgi:hypothetical protein
MANTRDSIDDFLQDGGVYPKVSANPANVAVQRVVAIVCAVCAFSFSPTIASDDTTIRCPQCDFNTPTGQ